LSDTPRTLVRKELDRKDQHAKNNRKDKKFGAMLCNACSDSLRHITELVQKREGLVEGIIEEYETYN